MWLMRQFKASIWKEGAWYIAQCLDVDIASQGESEEEALANLREAIGLHFTPPVATVMPKVAEISVNIDAA